MPNILICDDEKDIVNALKIYLADQDYCIYESFNGQEALQVIENQEIHLVLLDLMMPVMDGITAMRKIREISNVPVIMLTAKSEETDKILGLNVGADDYITKPFQPMEVVARVRSQLRRYLRLGGNVQEEYQYRCGGITMDDRAKEVLVDGDPVSLTPKEYEILLLLMKNPGKVFAPKEIYELVWKEKTFGSENNTVAVHIRKLRSKIEIDPSNPRYIKVIFGQGYRLEKPSR